MQLRRQQDDEGHSGPLPEVSRRTGGAVQIRVAAHVPVRHGAVKPEHAVLEFETLDGSALARVGPPQLHTSQRFLAVAASSATVPQLGRTLQEIPESESAWVSLYIGRDLERSGLHDPSAVDGATLVQTLLEPFAAWVV